MRRTFDFIETLISPTAKGEIYKITERSIPRESEINRCVEGQIQGWSIDPISGTSSRLGPETNPSATPYFPFGRNAGNFPEFGQIPRVLSVPVHERVFKKPEIKKSGGGGGEGMSGFVNVYITTPEIDFSQRGVYSGKHVNGSN